MPCEKHKANQLITRNYNDLTFTFRADGFFNMTKAAAHFGKRLDNFMSSTETKEYTAVLAEMNPEFQGSLTHTKKGYHTHPSVGTFAHPKLAVFFARWLDVRFAVWCDAMIEDILKGNAEVLITKPEQSAVLALAQDYGTALRALADSWEREQASKVVEEKLNPTKKGEYVQAKLSAKASAFPIPTTLVEALRLALEGAEKSEAA